MDEKTNVIRLLTQKKIKFQSYHLDISEAISGVKMAAMLKQDSAQVFKTLVTVGKTKTNYVFVIPVAEELDLKKAAKCVGEKSIEMIKSKELLPLTGYVHGGCSPIGMKKALKTTLHESAKDFDSIIFSAGKIGYQVQVTIADLPKILRLEYGDVIKDDSDLD